MGGRSKPRCPPPAVPVVLRLQELKLVLDPIARFGHGEFEARLARLVGGLGGAQRSAGGAQRGEEYGGKGWGGLGLTGCRPCGYMAGGGRRRNKERRGEGGPGRGGGKEDGASSPPAHPEGVRDGRSGDGGRKKKKERNNNKEKQQKPQKGGKRKRNN